MKFCCFVIADILYVI